MRTKTERLSTRLNTLADVIENAPFIRFESTSEVEAARARAACLPDESHEDNAFELDRLEGFSMELFACPVALPDEHQCRTVGCIAGWAEHVFGMEKALGLTDIQENALFTPLIPHKLWGTITPAQAAHACRNVANNPSIDKEIDIWSHLFEPEDFHRG